MWPSLFARLHTEGISRQEFVAAWPALCAGFFASLLIAWPLFLAGCTEYWGFANPDQAYYMTIVDHLENHAFGQPPMERVHEPRQDSQTPAGPSTTILGLCYLFPMVSVLTGIKSPFLFGVLCAAMLFLLPLSAYALCRGGFILTRAAAVITALLVASSAVAAQTFYHHSLGALTVAAVCPVGVMLGILYARKQQLPIAMLLAVLLAGMLFCYFPGFAVLGFLLGGSFLIPFLRREVAVSKLLFVAGLTVVIMAIVYSKHSLALSQMLIQETLSNRLATTRDETLLTIATVLTEDFVPFVWGLKILSFPTPSFLGPPPQDSAILFCCGMILFAIVALALGGGRLPVEFKGALGAVSAVTALYFARNNGYGVYKLITWLAPLVIVALGASCMALYARNNRLLRWLVVLILFSFTGLNLNQTLRLASYSRATELGALHNAPDIRLHEMRTLEYGAGMARAQALFAAVQDQVVQRWATPFLPDPNVYYLPVLTLDVQDSDSVQAKEYRRAVFSKLGKGQLLHTTPALKDIVAAPYTRPIWHNRVFAITALDQIHDMLILGAGWYRREIFAGIFQTPRPFRWLRKRAEILVLNPSVSPQRLCLTVLAGYGYPSPNRNLVLLLNGEKFDEVMVSGYSRFISRPFTASGPASQIEIMVREDAHPLPRLYGLWNHWVPREARRLNLAVFAVKLESEGVSGGVPSELDFRSEAQFGQALFNGIYPDRWLAGRASVEMRVPPKAKAICIRGTAPGGTTLVFPMPIRLHADHDFLGEAIVRKPGDFNLTVPVPDSLTNKGSRDVRLGIQPASGCFFNVAGGDTRCLTVRLERLSFISGHIAGAFNGERSEAK
jgi:hypothetical protein